MEMKNEIYIKQLMDDFFDGKTSVAQEKELYSYFSDENVAESLLKYKPLFHYFDEIISDEIEMLEDDLTQGYSDTIVSEKKVGKKKLYMILTAVAASLLLILFFRLFADEIEVNPYEGSYVIENGEKIYLSDVDAIQKMESEILARASQQEEEISGLFYPAKKQERAISSIEEEVNLKEKKYKKIMNNINAKIEKYEGNE